MHLHEKNKILGSYSPAFFHLHVNSDKPLSEILTGAEIGTLIHEYIHYLQDIGTTFGLSNLTYTITRLHKCYTHVREESSPTITIPLKLKFNNDPADFNEAFFRVYNGSSKGHNLVKPKIHKILKHQDSIKLFSGYHSQQNRYTILVTDPGEPDILYHFGAIAILESMARLAQKIIFPGKYETLSLPYSSVYLLSKEYFQGDDLENILLFAFCDAALMTYNPAEMLFSLFEYYAQKKSKPKSTSEIYDLFMALHKKTFGHDPLVLFNKRSKDAAANVTGPVTDPQFRPAGLWAKELVQRVSLERNRSISFLSDLLATTTNIGDRILDLMKTLGSPLVRNNKWETWAWPNDRMGTKEVDFVYIWLGIQELFQKLIDDQSFIPCQLQLYCQNLPKPSAIKTDDRCINEPWARIADSGPICTFAHVWSMWQFSGKHLDY